MFRVGRAMRTLFFIAGGGEGKMLALKISFCELNYMKNYSFSLILLTSSLKDKNTKTNNNFAIILRINSGMVLNEIS